jgi:mRNA interferase RelE/StbE
MKSVFEAGKIEQLKGYPSFYKVRFGSYRIGIKIENDVIILERALHRKEIYRFFP